MHFTRIKIKNYKSYFDAGEVTLEEGINLIIGKNNSGKTAFLELLSEDIKRIPHVNETQKPRDTSPIKNGTDDAVEIEVLISKKELAEIVEDKSDDIMYLNYIYEDDYDLYYEGYFGVPVFSDGPPGEEYFLGFRPVDYGQWLGEENQSTYTNLIPRKKTLEKFETIISQGFRIKISLPSKKCRISDFPEFSPPLSGNMEAVGFTNIYKKAEFSGFYKSIGHSYDISNICIKDLYENKVYKFNAQRVIAPTSPVGESKKLDVTCTNLATVLDNFQGNPGFNEYRKIITEVFPDIKDVSVVKEGTSCVIKVWMPQSGQREDLTIPLSDCGTGVGQVMAILFVVITATSPQILIIDEPNSFLHPSASRKLIEIFKRERYSHHQYIISTHSPEVIASAKSNNVLLLKIDKDGKTQIQKINETLREEMQHTLNEIGSKLSDIYGYDGIIWVEGETEERSFPLIVEKLMGKSYSTRRFYRGESRVLEGQERKYAPRGHKGLI